jgi:hypothetical protein
MSPDERRRVSGPGLRTFLNIADVWRLADIEKQCMLGADAASYAVWVRKARAQEPIELEGDVLLRISATLCIYQALRTLHASDAEAITWLRAANRVPPFAGRAPLELMTGGRLEELLATLQFLGGATQGLYMAPVSELDGDFQPYSNLDIKEDGDG